MEEQWIVYVTATDDVIECENEYEALRHANELNTSLAVSETSQYHPKMIAIATTKELLEKLW